MAGWGSAAQRGGDIPDRIYLSNLLIVDFMMFLQRHLVRGFALGEIMG